MVSKREISFCRRTVVWDASQTFCFILNKKPQKNKAGENLIKAEHAILNLLNEF